MTESRDRRIELRYYEQMVFLPCIHFVPVQVDGCRYFHQPSPVFSRFQNVGGGKILDAVWCGIAQGLEQTRGNQYRHIMRLTIQYPGSLLDGKASRKLSQQAQELMLILAHMNR